MYGERALAPRRSGGHTSLRRDAYPATSWSARAASAADWPPTNRPEAAGSPEKSPGKWTATQLTTAGRSAGGVGSSVTPLGVDDPRER